MKNKTEVKLNTDLCVIGGGLAGVCTAIAAARNGIKVVLIHERPVLGGNASSEIRMWVCGARGENNRETGIIEEIMLENLYRNPTKNHYIFDSVLLDFVRREKNITLLLNATCMDAESESGNFKYCRNTKIKNVSAYQMTTQKHFTVSAEIFADCSGDSVLAPLTGAEFMLGRDGKDAFGEKTDLEIPDKKTMGNSCLIQGRETTKKVSFIPSEFVTNISDDDVKNRPMNLYDSTENFWYSELGGDRNTIDDAEEIRDELIPLSLGLWNYIKTHPEYKAENWELEFLGFLPGKRESRRMKGEYIVTQNDISSDKIFEDTVAFGGWPVDDHYPGGYFHKGTPNTDYKTPAPYCLPYRALYSSNVENLMFAGRNISMTHLAMSSSRVMATCALLGQAAGTAAAIAISNRLTPHEVYLSKITELQETLTEADCFLPHFKRSISAECLLKAEFSALYNGQDRPNRIYSTEKEGVEIQNNTSVKYSFETPKKINSIHIVFDSDLNRETLPGDFCERGHVTRANVLLDSPVMYMPKTLCKAFALKITDTDGEKTLYKTDKNIKRAYNFPVLKNLKSIELIILSNWGESEKTNIVSFDFN